LLHYYDNEQKDIDNLVKYIKDNSSETKIETFAADLSKREEVEKLAEKAKSVFSGKVDVLFNNHATQQEVESILDLPDEQWTHVFDTNMWVFYTDSTPRLNSPDPLFSLAMLSSVLLKRSCE
jgi:NAD(P)-dependent dehydrogenase (short-subunit alcohol dehydrogenase family)